ncbi:MAG: 4-hydroxythreonine-4-phosphate dehydrogenase PdxA [Elusimicrobiota bacterium]
MRPTLAFIAGDPGGIGPEIAVKAMRERAVRRACRPVAVGPRAVFLRAGWRPGLAPLVDWGTRGRFPHRPTAAGGRLSYEIFRRCMHLSARGIIDGMVTGPVSKEAWRQAGTAQPDQTALICAETGAPETGMMLLGDGLRAVLVTRHIPLRRVARALDAAAIGKAARQACRAIRELLGVSRPHMGLCALNPHAGEGGLIGDEERSLLAPAAAGLRRRGLRCAGPLPADAAWAAHAAGRFDVLLALYHDQAMVPLKLRAGRSVVNWTIGAPVLRTAPGHGTAYDIAGRGTADPAGMIAAALLAAKIARKRG